jgi:hypothetical protein
MPRSIAIRDATLFCALLVLSTLAHTASATYIYIAGYEPQSNVTKHNSLDLDLKDIMAGLPKSNGQQGTSCTGDDCKWGSAIGPVETCSGHSGATLDTSSACQTSYAIWRYGKNSLKSSEVRSFWGFADGISGAGKNSGTNNPVGSHENQFIGRMNAYWKSKGVGPDSSGPDWAKDIIQAAFDGTPITHKTTSKGNVFNFATVGMDFRKEVIQKGISYLNAFPYVIWEMQDAVNDCRDGDLAKNDASGMNFGNSVYAWDEAVAFYTGSIEGASTGGIGDLSGKMQYYLGNKRCENFGTCTADTDGNDWEGRSKVNKEIFDLFKEGQEQLKQAAALVNAGSSTGTACDVVQPTLEKISTKMLVPFIQGTMRYLYKTKTSVSAKEAGELFAFASAALPFIDAVDPAAADMLFHRAWGLDFTDTTYSYDQIKTAIEGTYSKLGMGAGIGTISCADIGHLGSSTTTLAAGCTDPTSSSSKNNDTTLGLGIGIPLGAIAITAMVFVVLLWRKSSANSKRVEELTMQLRGPGKDFYP